MYCVNLVVDRNFGDDLYRLPQHEPVWVVDTPENHYAIKTAWAKRNNQDHLTGVTSYQPQIGEGLKNEILRLLATIEEHHGIYSHNPPYDILKIYGFFDADAIFDECTDYGFESFSERENYVEFTKTETSSFNFEAR